LECRRWHAYVALADPRGHCPHAGPGGDGHCGTNQVCAVYCGLLKNACSDKFNTQFGTNASLCEQQCSKVTGGANINVGYSVGAMETLRNDTYQCRLHGIAVIHESKGMMDMMGQKGCDSVFPTDTCKPIE
jgi:hypothetical protein